jgi:hypothetical protein
MMSSASTQKMRIPIRAVDLLRECPLGPDALALLNDDLPVRGYIDLLSGRRLYRDATLVIAYALAPLIPERAIWWGCLCAWWLYRVDRPAPVERGALEAAVRWVLKPGEDARRAAERAGMAAELSNPAGCLALAAFWTGNNLAPPGQPPLPAPSDLVPKTLAGAIELTAARAAKAGLDAPYERFIALALEVDQGRLSWKSA